MQLIGSGLNEMDLSIIVPCYNEIENVPKLRQEFLPVVADLAQSHSLEVIFVDDGSIDGTGLALETTFVSIQPLQVTIRFERHQVNRGLGAALRTGFAAAHGEVIVTTDSDGTYRFSEIPGLLSSLADDVDVVTASPYHPLGRVEDVPTYRLMLSRGSSAIYQLLVDRHVNTYTSVFRAYRRRVVERVSFESDGFLASTELLVKALLLGYRVAEYPTVLHSRISGASKAKLVQTVLAHLVFQARVLGHRLHLAVIVEKDRNTRVPGAEVVGMVTGYRDEGIRHSLPK